MIQVIEDQVSVFQNTSDNNDTLNEAKFAIETILKDKSKISVFKKDSFIFQVNDPSDQLYIVDKGRVKIGDSSKEGKEVLKSILGEGEIFGEMALAGERVRKDFALAMDDHTIVRSLSKGEMKEIMNINPEINEAIFQIMGIRIRKTERRLFSIILKDARTRIVDFLKDLAEEKGQKVGFETMIKNHFTHKDIANLTGTSRQTVTTTLNALRDKNIINFDRRRILIRDLDLLV